MANSFLIDNMTHDEHMNTSTEEHIHLAALRYDYVRMPLLVTGFLFVLCIFKLVFEKFHRLKEFIPESCMLMILGVMIGFLLTIPELKRELDFLTFNAQTFFIYLLPPIVLDASYSFKHQAFLENLSIILIYALVGTIINVFIIGPSLYGCYLLGAMGDSWTLTLVECVVFGTMVAATDPVAALAIFQSMGVNKVLYFIVFGESLFNDGIAMVLYNTVIGFLEVEAGAKEIATEIGAFFCICLGAVAIGTITGFVSALIAKHSSESPTLEPFFLLGPAYLSYLIAQLFDFSGMISLICCGLIQAHYAMENISPSSLDSARQLSSLASTTAESLMFITLSVMAVLVSDAWMNFNVAFALLAVLFCLLARFIVTYGFSCIINRASLGTRQLTRAELFILAYAGLRGPITFSLAFSLDANLLQSKQKTQHVLLTSAYIVIFFTTFLQGMTMKPLVKLMKIQLHTEVESAFDQSAMTGLDIMPRHEPKLVQILKRLSKRYLRPLVNKNHSSRHTVQSSAAYLNTALHLDHIGNGTIGSNQSSVIKLCDMADQRSCSVGCSGDDHIRNDQIGVAKV